MPTKTIQDSAAATIKRLEEKDRGLGNLLKKAYAYAVFPAVGKASLVVGGAYGRGAVFEKGEFVGYATLSQLTLGVQLGGDTFTEVLVFKDKGALDQLKKGKMAFAANASAVLVKAGKAAAKGFPNGVTAYTYTRGGELLELSIGGQKFSFKPADEEEMEDQGEEEGEEQEQPARGAAKGKAASQEAESDEGEEESDEEGEGAEDGGEDEEAGVLGRAMGGVKSAASRVADTAKEHPVAATVVGTALAVTAAYFVVRAVRNRSGQEEDGEEDTEAQDQADEGEEEQGEGDEENDQGDTLNQLRRRRSRA
jgi:hypothetical protein